MSRAEQRRNHTIFALEAVISRGAKTVRGIQALTHLSEETIRKHLKEGTVQIRDDVEPHGVELVIEATDQGYGRTTEVAEHTGLAKTTAGRYLTMIGEKEDGRGVSNEEFTKRYGTALKRNVPDLERFWAIMGLSPLGTYFRCKDLDLAYPEILGPYELEQFEDVNVLVAKRLSLNEISKLSGKSRTHVVDVMHAQGTFDEWKADRDRMKEEAKKLRAEALQLKEQENLIRTDWLTALNSYFADRAREKGECLGKAARVAYTRRGSTPPLRILSIARLMDEARADRRTLSYEQIGRHFRMEKAQVGELLRELGIPSMYYNAHQRSRLTPDEETEIKYCVEELGLLPTDIQHFKESLVTNPSQLMRRLGIVTKPRNYLGGVPFMTFALASQIFEAEDAGIFRYEMPDLFYVIPRNFEYVDVHRTELTDTIKEAISRLNGIEAEKPWFTRTPLSAA